jgi:hypothetical protein
MAISIKNNTFWSVKQCILIVPDYTAPSSRKQHSHMFVSLYNDYNNLWLYSVVQWAVCVGGSG